MLNSFNKFLDWFSEYFAARKGLIPLIGILLVVLNFIFQFVPAGFLSSSNLCLHLGIIVAIIGLMLSWTL
jgi:hypothetical protein